MSVNFSLNSSAQTIASILHAGGVPTIPCEVSPNGISFTDDRNIVPQSSPLLTLPGIKEAMPSHPIGIERFSKSSQFAAEVCLANECLFDSMRTYIGYSKADILRHVRQQEKMFGKYSDPMLCHAAFETLMLPVSLRILTNDRRRYEKSADDLVTISNVRGRNEGLSHHYDRAFVLDLATTFYRKAISDYKANPAKDPRRAERSLEALNQKLFSAHLAAARAFSDVALLNPIEPQEFIDVFSGKIMKGGRDPFGCEVTLLYGVYHAYWGGEVDVLCNLSYKLALRYLCIDDLQAGNMFLRSAAMTEELSGKDLIWKIKILERLSKGLSLLKQDCRSQEELLSVKPDSQHALSRRDFQVLGLKQYLLLDHHVDSLSLEIGKEGRQIVQDYLNTVILPDSLENATARVARGVYLKYIRSLTPSPLTEQELSLTPEKVLKKLNDLGGNCRLLFMYRREIEVIIEACARLHGICEHNGPLALKAGDKNLWENWNHTAAKIESAIDDLLRMIARVSD